MYSKPDRSLRIVQLQRGSPKQQSAKEKKNKEKPHLVWDYAVICKCSILALRKSLTLLSFARQLQRFSISQILWQEPTWETHTPSKTLVFLTFQSWAAQAARTKIHRRSSPSKTSMNSNSDEVSVAQCSTSSRSQIIWAGAQRRTIWSTVSTIGQRSQKQWLIFRHCFLCMKSFTLRRPRQASHKNTLHLFGMIGCQMNSWWNYTSEGE